MKRSPLVLARIALIVGIVGIVLGGCGSPGPETPGQAVEAILGLYEARDFDALVRTRYAEIAKAPGEKEIQALIARFENRFRDPARLEEAVSTYRSLRQATPEMSEDGSTATYPIGDHFVRLSRMPDGKWGFNL